MSLENINPLKSSEAHYESPIVVNVTTLSKIYPYFEEIVVKCGRQGNIHTLLCFFIQRQIQWKEAARLPRGGIRCTKRMIDDTQQSGMDWRGYVAITGLRPDLWITYIFSFFFFFSFYIPDLIR